MRSAIHGDISREQWQRHCRHQLQSRCSSAAKEASSLRRHARVSCCGSRLVAAVVPLLAAPGMALHVVNGRSRTHPRCCLQLPASSARGRWTTHRFPSRSRSRFVLLPWPLRAVKTPARRSIPARTSDLTFADQILFSCPHHDCPHCPHHRATLTLPPEPIRLILPLQLRHARAQPCILAVTRPPGPIRARLGLRAGLFMLWSCGRCGHRDPRTPLARRARCSPAVS